MDKWANLGASFIVLLIVTTLVLPGRQSPAVITSGGNALAKLAKTGLGQG